MNYAAIISNKLELNQRQVEKTIELLEQGATVPFIARYRKEVTGSLNEVQIAAIRDLLLKLKELDKRREAVMASIEEQGKLTDGLRQQLLEAETLTDLEDLYLPYRPKRRTRAMIAIEKGYEPIADAILRGQCGEWDDEALSGARDIIAERISEDAQCRNRVRNVFRRRAMLSSGLARGVDEDDERVAKFESWLDWKEPIGRAPSHRILALFRGEEAGVLKVHVKPEKDDECIEALTSRQRPQGKAGTQYDMAVADSYKRLVMPSIETEFRNMLKEKADKEAIRVFAENLRQLLLAAPMGQKRTLAIDPGFRTGCKVVCLDAEGNPRYEDALKVAAGRHDLSVIRVTDPREETIPPMGLVDVKDSETLEGAWINTSSPRVRRLYSKWFSDVDAKLRKTLLRYKVDSVGIRTDEDYVNGLMSLFRMR